MNGIERMVKMETNLELAHGLLQAITGNSRQYWLNGRELEGKCVALEGMLKPRASGDA